jgi:hypothetical protein
VIGYVTKSVHCSDGARKRVDEAVNASEPLRLSSPEVSERCSAFAKNKNYLFCDLSHATIFTSPSASVAQCAKSKPRNGARDIFATTVADTAGAFVSTANPITRGIQKTVQTVMKQALPNTETTAVSIS